ncbi:hypothetical protein SUGI_0945620 [Cryptomeria japonica]|nr:hypothetical protein SUGI_0945620 [Cryptomeria japonica]
MVQGNRYSRPWLNFGNPYSKGNQCPIDPHKWKENGFIWINKGWFCKTKHPASEAPRNWYPPPKPSISGAAPERGNPHSDSFLVPPIDHGNPQNWNGCFKQYNSRADQARFWRSNFRPNNRNPWSSHERHPTFRRAASLPQRPHFHKPVRKTSRPTIFLDENKINSARSNLLESCLFIKWGGAKRVKDNFESWCRAQWGKDININILPNDFYMIEFMSNNDKWQAQNKGLYILDGIEVHTIDWQPNFNPRTYVPSNNKVWIRLYNCPSDYWHIDVIKDIYKDLGTFVSADDILEDKLWGSFLRICISTDQITKIPDEVRIIGVNLQPEPSIAFDTGEAICNNTLDNENVPLTEATPLIIIPPSSSQCKSQQDLLTLLEKIKTLQADIESKLADSLPPSPCVPRNQLVIEDDNLHSTVMETGTLREMGGQICSSTGIELEDGEIETLNRT